MPPSPVREPEVIRYSWCPGVEKRPSSSGPIADIPSSLGSKAEVPTGTESGTEPVHGPPKSTQLASEPGRRAGSVDGQGGLLDVDQSDLGQSAQPGDEAAFGTAAPALDAVAGPVHEGEGKVQSPPSRKGGAGRGGGGHRYLTHPHSC